MNLITIGLGAFAIIFGIGMFILRASRLEKFGERENFFKRFTKKSAYTPYLIAYSIIPIIFGVFLILAGYRGYALV